MVSADVALSDMSRLINLKFIACFWSPTPSVTDATSFPKVAMHILQLIFKEAIISELQTMQEWDNNHHSVLTLFTQQTSREVHELSL